MQEKRRARLRVVEEIRPQSEKSVKGVGGELATGWSQETRANRAKAI
jgi:hypothetical protein